VLDMAEVTFIDSTIIGVVVAAVKRCAAGGGQLRLAQLQEIPARVIEVVGLESLVHGEQASDGDLDQELERILTS
jgi:anti-anti-sigma factor